MVFTISLICGIILPSTLFFVFFVLLILFSLYLFFYIKYKRHFILTIALGFAVGMLLSSFTAGYDAGEIHKFEGEYASCDMLVTGVPVITEKYIKFEATVKSINNIETKEKVLVYVYDANCINMNHIISFNRIKFEQPDDQRNPGSFNYRKYLSGKEIFFVGTASIENIIASEPAKRTLLSEAAFLNKKLSDKIDSLLSVENSSLFKAILLGDKSDVDEGTLNHFRDSGLSHIMAVSGLHLSIIVMLLNVFLKKANRWIKFIVSFVFVTCFSLLTGLPVSVVRAGIMLLVLQFTDAMFLEGDSLTNLALAALVILIPNPHAVYDIGFVMSFSAT
ncbi:MAG: ComEC family competence protein, partial [Clostridia bacterium]|nr:ComEC family competence protein [Clostridia bacterium]